MLAIGVEKRAHWPVRGKRERHMQGTMQGAIHLVTYKSGIVLYYPSQRTK